jgi:hypothetical protein
MVGEVAEGNRGRVCVLLGKRPKQLVSSAFSPRLLPPKTVHASVDYPQHNKNKNLSRTWF